MSAWAKGLRSSIPDEENAFKRRSYALAQESSVLRDHHPNNRTGRPEQPTRPRSLHNVAPGHPPLHGPLTQIAEHGKVRSLSKSPGRKPSQRGVSPSRIPKALHGKNLPGDENLNLSSSPSSFETNEKFYSQTHPTSNPLLSGQNFSRGQLPSMYGQNIPLGEPHSWHGQNFSQGQPLVNPSLQSSPKKIPRGKSPSRIPKSTIESFQNALKSVWGSKSQTDDASSASSIFADSAHRRSLTRGTSPSRIPSSNQRRESQASYDLQLQTLGISPTSNQTSNSAIDLSTGGSHSWSSNASFRRGTSPSRIPRSNSKRDLNKRDSPSSPTKKSPRGISPSRIPRSNSKRDLSKQESSSVSPNDRALTRGTSPSRIPRSNSKRDLASQETLSTYSSDRTLTRGTSPSRIPRSNSKRDLASHGNLSSSTSDRTLTRGISPSRIPRSNSKRDLVAQGNLSTFTNDRTLTRGTSPSRIPRSNSNKDLHSRANQSESPNKNSVPRGISPSRIPRSNSKKDLISQSLSSSPTKTAFHYDASPSTDYISSRNADASPSGRPSEPRGRNVQTRGMTPTSKSRNGPSIPDPTFQRQRSLKNSSGSSPGQVPAKKREQIEPRQLSGTNNNMNVGVPRKVQEGVNNNPFARADSLNKNRPRSQYDPPSNSYSIPGKGQRPLQETSLDDFLNEPRKKKKVRIRHPINPRDLIKQREFTKSENNMYVSSSSSESESSLGIIDLHSDSSISLIDLTPRANEFLYSNQGINNTSHVNSPSHQAIRRVTSQPHGYDNGQRTLEDTDPNGNPFHSRIVSPTSFRPLTDTKLSVYHPNENTPSSMKNKDSNYPQQESTKRNRIFNTQNENTGPAKAPRTTISAKREFIPNVIPNHPNRHSMFRSLENLDDVSSVAVSLNTASSRRSSLYSMSPALSMGSLSPIMHSRRIIEYDRPTAEAVNDYPPLYTPPPPPSHSNSTFSTPARRTNLFSGNAIQPQQTPRHPSREVISTFAVLPGSGPSVDKAPSVARDNKYHEQRGGGPKRSPSTGGKPTSGYDVTKYPSQQSISGQGQKNNGPHGENILSERIASEASPNNSGFGDISSQHQPVPLPRQRLSSGHEQLQNQSQLQHSDPRNYQQQQQQQQQPKHQYQQQYSVPNDNQQLKQQQQPEHQYQQQYSEQGNIQQLQQQQQPGHQKQQQYSQPPNPQQLQQEQEHQYQHQFSEPADLHQLKQQQEHQYQQQFSEPADLHQLKQQQEQQFLEPADLRVLDHQQHHPHLSNHLPLLNKNQPRPQQSISEPKKSRQHKKRTPADAAQEATTPQRSTKGSRWFGRGNRPSQLDSLSDKRGVDPLTQSSPSGSNSTNKQGRDDHSIGNANDSAGIKGQVTHSTTPTGDTNIATAVAESPQSGAGVAAGLTDSSLALPNAHPLAQQSSVSNSGARTEANKPGHVGLLASLFNRKLNGVNPRYPPEGDSTALVPDGVNNDDLKESSYDKENRLLVGASDKGGPDNSGGVGDLKVYGLQRNGNGIENFPFLRKELGLSIVNAPKDALNDNLENHNLLETLKFRESDQCRDLGIDNTAFDNTSLNNGQLNGKISFKPTDINNFSNSIPPLNATVNKHPNNVSANDTKGDVRGSGNLNLTTQTSGQGPLGIDPHNSQYQPQGLLGIGTRSTSNAEHQPSTQLGANVHEPVDLLDRSHEIVKNWQQDSLGSQNPTENVSSVVEAGRGHISGNSIVVASGQGYHPSEGLIPQATDIDHLANRSNQESALRGGAQSIGTDRRRVRGTMEDNMVNGSFEMGVPADAVRDGKTNHTGGLVNNSYEVDAQPPNSQSNNSSGAGHGRKREKRKSPEKIPLESDRALDQTTAANESAGPVDIMQMRLNCLQDKPSKDKNKKSKSQKNKDPNSAPKRPLVQKSMLQEKAKENAKPLFKPSKQKNGVKAASATPKEERRSSKDSASSLVKKRGFFRRRRSNSRSSLEGDDHSESAITVGSEAQGHPLAGVETRTYWTRFYILGLFSIIATMECVIWGTWGPIMESARFAFPSWTSGTISLLNSWGPIVCILFIVPVAWLNQRFGLRVGIVLCTSLMAAGTLIRCIPADETTFTWLANTGAFTNAISGCLTLSLPAMIAATWFPPNERTTATAVAGLFSQLGSAVMYLEPFVVRVPPYAESGNEECSSYSRNYINSQREERALGTSQDSSDRTRYIRSLLITGVVEQERRLPSFLSHSVVDSQHLPELEQHHVENIQKGSRKLKRSAQRAPNPAYKDDEETLDPNQRFDLSGSSLPPDQSNPMDPTTFFGGPTTPSEDSNIRNGSPNRNRFSNPSDLRNHDRLHGSPFGDQSSNPSNQRDPSDPSRPVSSTPNYRNQDRLHYSDSDNQPSNPSDQRGPSDPTRPVSSTPNYRNQDRLHYSDSDNPSSNPSDQRYPVETTRPVSSTRGYTNQDRRYDSSLGDQSSKPQSSNNGDETSRFSLRVPPSSSTSGSEDPYGRNQSRNGLADNKRYQNPSEAGTHDEARWQQDPRVSHSPSTYGRSNGTDDDGRVNYHATVDRDTQNGSTGDRNSQRNPDGTRNYIGNNDADRNYQGNGVGDRNGGGPRTYQGFDGGRRTYPGDDGPRPTADEEDSTTVGPFDRSNLRGRAPGSELSPEDVYGDIMILMYIHAGIAVFLLILSVCYFPARPKLPPSQSSAMERHDYFASIKIMFCNRQLMLLVLTYVFSVGIPIVWVAVMNFSLCCIGIRQGEAMYVAITAVVLSCCTAFIAARVTDVLYGHLKITCVVLLLGASTCFLWFLLLSMGVIAPDLVQVYISVAGGIALQYATVPLLIELAVELAYPCPESVVGAFLTWTFNIVSGTFLLLFLIPSSCYTWVNIVLVACTSVTVIPLAFVKETHRRRAEDNTTRGGGTSNRPVVVPKFVVEYAESVQRQREASGEQRDEYQDTFPPPSQPATLPGTPSSLRSAVGDNLETNI